MGKHILVDINPYQTRVVLLEDDTPLEIYIEHRGKERLVGNIYHGKVKNVLPGMQAAFVDIGLERNAFLYAGDIQVDRSEFQFQGDTESKLANMPVNIQDIVKPGQDIIVQVFKEPVGTKGARVTTHITLPGRSLVLMPTMNYIGVSRRINDEAERSRLKTILEEMKPDNIGLIVRTAGYGKTQDELESDLNFLLRLWERIDQKGRFVQAPCLLHAEEPLIFRTIRDLFTTDIDRLTINNQEFYERIQIVANIISPQMKDKVVLYQGEEELFDRYGVETKIDKALARKVWLNNGGYIVIDQTEALTSIDVNTGRFVGNDNLQETITQANCEAAKEIARQIRLRDLSGIIIIDFIDMEDSVDQELVLDTLKEELKKDRTKSNVLGMTQLGLVEMTRKKMRRCISDTLQTTCPVCQGCGRVLAPETVVLKLRKVLLKRFREDTSSTFLAEVHPAIASYMVENVTAQTPLIPSGNGRTVYIRSVPYLQIDQFHILQTDGDPNLPDLHKLLIYG